MYLTGIAGGPPADYAAVALGKLARAPERISLSDAAAVPLAGLTALPALRGCVCIERSSHVIELGASGGVGSFAMQIAKALGASVSGVASTSKADFVQILGADDVIDYQKEHVADHGKTWDVIVDAYGGYDSSEFNGLLAPRS